MPVQVDCFGLDRATLAFADVVEGLTVMRTSLVFRIRETRKNRASHGGDCRCGGRAARRGCELDAELPRLGLVVWTAGNVSAPVPGRSVLVHIARQLGDPLAIAQSGIDSLDARYQNVYGPDREKMIMTSTSTCSSPDSRRRSPLISWSTSPTCSVLSCWSSMTPPPGVTFGDRIRWKQAHYSLASGFRPAW